MASRPPDIEELERLLNNGEGDGELNAQAIKIYERIKNEARKIIPYGSLAIPRQKELYKELSDLEGVIEEIVKRRHAHVLDRFIKHVEKDHAHPVP